MKGRQIPPSLNRHFRAPEENLRLGGAIGSTFRRDVILQDQINLIDNSIQAAQNHLNTTGLSQKMINFNKSAIKQLQGERKKITQEQGKITEAYGN